MRKIQRWTAVGALAGLTAVVGACGSADVTSTADLGGTNGPGAPQTSEPTTDASADVTTDASAVAAEAGGVTTIEQIYGPACDRLPDTGEGSARGMIDDSVATAASNNPLLTTLTKALKRVDLVDTLNNPEAEFTVFAPTNGAFEKLPPGTLDELSDAELTNILTYHVVPTRYDAESLAVAGEVTTLLGDTLQIMGQKGSLTIDETEQAQVLCGNIPTANATVFVIDTVLMPDTGDGGAAASTEPQG